MNPGKNKKIQLAILATIAVLIVTVFFLWIENLSIANIESGEGPDGLTALDDSLAINQYHDSQNQNSSFSSQAFEILYSDPDSARTIARYGLQNYGDTISDNETIFLTSIIGMSYLFQSDYSQALRKFYETLRLATLFELEPETAHAYGNIGITYLAIENSKVALDYLLKAQNAYVLLDDTVNYASAHNNIATVYLKIVDLDKVNFHLSEAQQGFEKQNHKIGLSAVTNQWGRYYMLRNKPDSAIYYFDKSVGLGIETNNSFNLTLFYQNTALLYYEMDQYKDAISYFHKADSTATSINFMQGLSSSRLGLSRNYLRLDNLDSALHYVNEAKDIALNIGNAMLEYEANEVLANIYYQKSEFRKAFEYNQLSQVQKDSLMEIAQLYQVYNLEIDQLNREKEIQQMKIQEQELDLVKRRNALTLSIILGIGIIVILSFSYLLYVNKMKQQQRNRLYEDKLQHSAELTKAVLQAEVQERKRIAFELHDGLGPLLSISKMNVTNILEDDSLSMQRQRDLLQKTVCNLDDTLYEMKYISQNLAPMVLLEKGFEAAIKDLVTRIKHLKKYEVQFNVNGLNGSLEPFIQHALYRTIQEVVNNIIKHAGATEINLELLQSKHDITVMLEDNGVGFNTKDPGSGGLGLQNAESRILGLNGSFFVDSMIGRGTIITIILPLTKESQTKSAVLKI